MKKTAILSLCFISVLTTGIATQTNYQNQAAISDFTRPRLAETVAKAGSSVIVDSAAAERIAFDMINQKRTENGLKVLAWSDELETLASQHSRDMADNKYFGHRGLDNSMVSDRADRSGLKKWRSIGENIAFNRGYKDPIKVAVKLWMESTAHRQNLLDNNWKESAVGVAVASDGSYYFTQVFLLRR